MSIIVEYFITIEFVAPRLYKSWNLIIELFCKSHKLNFNEEFNIYKAHKSELFKWLNKYLIIYKS